MNLGCTPVRCPALEHYGFSRSLESSASGAGTNGGNSCVEAKRLVPALRGLGALNFKPNDLEVMGLNSSPEQVRDVKRYYTEETCLKLACPATLVHTA